MRAWLTLLCLISISLAAYINKVDAWDMPQFQVTQYNPITSIPPEIGNFTLNVTFPFEFSKDQTFTVNNVSNTSYMFFHCFFNSEETVGIQLEITKQLEIPQESMDATEETSFSSLRFLTKASIDAISSTNVISLGTASTTNWNATDYSHVGHYDAITFGFYNLTSFNGLSTNFNPLQYYGLNNGGMHSFYSCYASDFKYNVSVSTVVTTSPYDFSTMSLFATREYQFDNSSGTYTFQLPQIPNNGNPALTGFVGSVFCADVWNPTGASVANYFLPATGAAVFQFSFNGSSTQSLPTPVAVSYGQAIDDLGTIMFTPFGDDNTPVLDGWDENMCYFYDDWNLTTSTYIVGDWQVSFYAEDLENLYWPNSVYFNNNPTCWV